MKRSRDFEALYREHHDFVWSTVRRLGVPRALTDDATQDVFATVHRRLATFEGRANVRSWIYGIARRVASRYRRTNIRLHRKHAAVAVALTTATRGRSDPEPAVLVEQVLDALSDRVREAFVLSQVEGMTGAEIARMLEISEPAVHARLRAARKRFASLVRDDQRLAVLLAPWLSTTTPPATAIAANWAVLHVAPAAMGIAGQVAVFAATVLFGTAVLTVVHFRLDADEDTPRVADATPAAVPAHSPQPLAALPSPMPSAGDPGDALERVRTAPKVARSAATSRSRRRRSPSPDKPPASARKSAASSLSAEKAAAEAALAQLEAGAPDRALATLRAYASAHPGGMLLHERRRLEFRALCALGRATQARKLAGRACP